MRHARILERFLSYELSSNMKASIVIHSCVALIRNHRVTSQLTVAVVCPGSMATGRYLEAQLKNYFDFCIVGVYPAADVLARLEAAQAQDEPPVDLILSTVPLVTDRYRVLQVHPFLSMVDMNRIQQLSFACQKPLVASALSSAPADAFLHDLHALMERHQVPSSLRHELEQAVQAYEHRQETKRKSAISELLRFEYITEDDGDLDWQTAMHHSAAPLEQVGCVEPRYIEKAIEHVKEYGDYIVVKEQSDAHNGEIVVAMIDDSATVKTFYREKNRIRLQPENDTMSPIYADNPVILGKVTALIRSIS